MTIRKETYLKVADNSGAIEVQCIHIVGGTRKKMARVGDLIKCSVKKAVPDSTVKKKQVCLGVIVRTRKESRRDDGGYIRFSDNAVVLIKEDKTPLGTRVFGPVVRELRQLGFSKIISLAPEVL